MKVAIVPGHTMSGKGTGAVGYINESKENRILTDLIVKWLKIGGATVYTDRVDEANTYLARQVAIANKQPVDVAVQIHFNANKTTDSAVGTEVLYKSNAGKVFAERVVEKLGTIYKQRGVKIRTDLYWINSCHAPTILIETCFCDSKADTNVYKSNKDKTAKLIAEGILGKSIVEPQQVIGKYPLGAYGKMVLVTEELNVRDGRGTEHGILGKIKANSKVIVNYILQDSADGKGSNDLWGRIDFDGEDGYIHLGYTKAL